MTDRTHHFLIACHADGRRTLAAFFGNCAHTTALLAELMDIDQSRDRGVAEADPDAIINAMESPGHLAKLDLRRIAKLAGKLEIVRELMARDCTFICTWKRY